MDDSTVILATFETWKRHSMMQNVYIGQLSYLFSDREIKLPDHPLEAFLEAARRDDVNGFSVETGAIKIIVSDRPVIFASSEE